MKQNIYPEDKCSHLTRRQNFKSWDENLGRCFLSPFMPLNVQELPAYFLRRGNEWVCTVLQHWKTIL